MNTAKIAQSHALTPKARSVRAPSFFEERRFVASRSLRWVGATDWPREAAAVAAEAQTLLADLGDARAEVRAPARAGMYAPPCRPCALRGQSSVFLIGMLNVSGVGWVKNTIVCGC